MYSKRLLRLARLLARVGKPRELTWHLILRLALFDAADVGVKVQTKRTLMHLSRHASVFAFNEFLSFLFLGGAIMSTGLRLADWGISKMRVIHARVMSW